jgi:hypothetical protein
VCNIVCGITLVDAVAVHKPAIKVENVGDSRTPVIISDAALKYAIRGLVRVRLRSVVVVIGLSIVIYHIILYTHTHTLNTYTYEASRVRLRRCGGRHWTVKRESEGGRERHRERLTHTHTHTRSLATRFSFALSSCQFRV